MGQCSLTLLFQEKAFWNLTWSPNKHILQNLIFSRKTISDKLGFCTHVQFSREISRVIIDLLIYFLIKIIYLKQIYLNFFSQESLIKTCCLIPPLFPSGGASNFYTLQIQMFLFLKKTKIQDCSSGKSDQADHSGFA